MNKKFDIFFSYSNKDIELVQKLVDNLKFFGLKIWFQLDNSKLDFINEINEGIINSKAFICFISHASINSLRVRNEINRALFELENNPEFKIVPIVYSDLDNKDKQFLSLLAGSINWLFLNNFDDLNKTILEILNSIDFDYNKHQLESRYASQIKAVEADRIHFQHLIYYSHSVAAFEKIFELFKKPFVLDFGCGDGEFMELFLKNHEVGGYLGVDSSKDQIEKASKRPQANYQKDFLCGQANIDKFLMRKGIKGFDLICVGAVLLHCIEPERIIEKLFTLLKPGGYIFIIEEDDGFNVAYPNDPFFGVAKELYEHSLLSGDRSFGRKIPFLLQKSNFCNIKLHETSIWSINLDAQLREFLWDLYYNPNLWSTIDESCFDSKEAFSLLKPYKERHALFKSDYLKGKYFISLGVLVFTAQKPLE